MSKQKRAPLKPGDVYAAKLSDGRYGALRILRVAGKSMIVACTPYLAEDVPSIEDPVLRETVVRNRFAYREQPAVFWLQGRPSGEFLHVGTLELGEPERSTECNIYSGGWSASAVKDAFLEWRWVHDRPAFEAEIRRQHEEAARLARIPKEPGRMIDETSFWAVIQALDWSQKGNDDRVLVPAIERLAKHSPVDICAFEERFAYLLYQLDTREHGRQSLNDPEDFFSSDGFLYARCVVVANGEAFYRKVLKDPAQMPKNLEFEALLSLGPRAYEKRTGEEMDHLTGCSYETGSNPLGWPERRL